MLERIVFLVLLADSGCMRARMHMGCVAEDGEECSMSSLLLQTDTALSKSKPRASPIDTKGVAERVYAETLVDAHMIVNKHLLRGLGNAYSTLQQLIDKLDGSHFLSYEAFNASLTSMMNVRDAIALALPSTSPDDMGKLAPVGMTLTKAAEDFFKFKIRQGRDGLKSVLEVLANVSLPDGDSVFSSFMHQEPTLPAEHIYYGNWCGQFRPPGDCGPVKDCHMLPINPLDNCCKEHDVGYADAYPKLRCETKTKPDDGDKPDCLLYDNHACEKLAGVDKALSICAAAVACPPYDTGCTEAKDKIMKLYGISAGMYAAGEAACPPIRVPV